MTYQTKELQDQERYMEEAEKLIEAALREARKLNRAGLLEQIEFERCCMHGRRMELKAKADPDKRPTAAEIDTAKESIKIAMRRFRESDWDKFSDNEDQKHGNWWLERLEKLKSRLLGCTYSDTVHGSNPPSLDSLNPLTQRS